LTAHPSPYVAPYMISYTLTIACQNSRSSWVRDQWCSDCRTRRIYSREVPNTIYWQFV